MEDITLPINTMPLIKSYAHHAFSNAIIDNGEQNQDISIKFSFIDSNIVTDSTNSVIQRGERIFVISDENRKKDKDCIIDRFCISEDEYIVLQLQQMKKINLNSEFGFMLSTKAIHDIELSICRLFYSNEGAVITYYEKTRDIKGSPKIRHMYCELPVFLKVEKQRSMIVFSCSSDNKNWKECLSVSIKTDSPCLAIYYRPKSFDYYNWFYSNYIQWHCDPYMGTHKVMQDVELDFFTGPKIRGNYYLTNPFIFSECISRRHLIDIVNIREFIIESLRRGCCIQALLNERYIPDRNAFGRVDYNHTNLIVGCIMTERVYEICGFDCLGHFSISKVDFQSLEKAFGTGYPIKENEDYVYLLSLSSPENEYPINIELIISFLEDYLSSKNSFERCSFITYPIYRVFGMKVYDVLKRYLQDIACNQRVFYTIQEHKTVMRKRIEYLYHTEVFNSDQFYLLDTCAQGIEERSNLLLNLSIKYNMYCSKEKTKEMENVLHKMHSLIEEICTLEYDLFLFMIEELKRKKCKGEKRTESIYN